MYNNNEVGNRRKFQNKLQGEADDEIEETEDETGKSAVSLARKSFKIMLPFIVNNFVYPYSVVSTIMAVSGSG